MKLKEIKLPAKASYAADFFAEVAKASEGKYFLYEEAGTGNSIRSAAYNYGRRLKRKFTVVTVKDENGAEQFAVAVTSKARKPRKKVAVINSAEIQQGGGYDGDLQEASNITGAEGFVNTSEYRFGEEGQ